MAELTHITYTNKNPALSYGSSDSNDLKHNDREKNSFENTAFERDTMDEQAISKANSNHQDGERGVEKEDIEEEDKSNAFSRAVGRIQYQISSLIKAHSSVMWIFFYIGLILAYFAYFAIAMHYRFGDDGSWRLMVLTVIFSVGLFLNLVLKFCLRRKVPNNKDSFTSIKNCFKAINKVASKIRFATISPLFIIIGLIAYILAEVAADRPKNVISLGGLIFFIFAFFVFSYNPSKVKWRPVIWGVALQFIFAVLVLRTSWGRDAFKYLGDRVTEFLDYTDAGSKFVFGDLLVVEKHVFAFKILPVVVYFSTFVSILYYLGVMQAVIKQLGRFLAFCLGTSPTESVNAAGNIFIGQTEAPLMIRPFLADMTKSEIHAVMTGGFATIAGSVMAAYILYKIPANHLLSASVMSAPAALAVSKLFYPETEKSRHSADAVYNIAKGTERNLIEAASNGASMSIKLVANIAVNLIAFVALLDFVNATLIWLGDRVGFDGLTFQLICSYIFWPLAFLMGVEVEDCRVVGQLIGTKTFLNEFVAYTDLSVYINNRIKLNEYINNATMNGTSNMTGNWTQFGDYILLHDTGEKLLGGLLSVRSVVIATYALCGFSNLSSMGVQLGALGAMAPHRKSDMSKIVFRAMIAGNVACFMTACIAGLFYEDE